MMRPSSSTEISLTSITPGRQSALVGRLKLEELWRTVDKVRVGSRGHAVLVDGTGRLAHSDPPCAPAWRAVRICSGIR
jgi:hypothetical protein